MFLTFVFRGTHIPAFLCCRILLWIRDKTTIIPNLAVRVCEYMLGRISLMELVALLPIHFVAMLSTSVFVRQILPGDWSTFVVEPIEYSNKNAWLDVSYSVTSKVW